ncbi:hypothetical protein DASB73_023060 [Starmerella bacillaris]|uniref:Sm domain-containing protein n=1 Tax=Starmerella bacillaris TaxID=1247836 RepID=A0AAV5RIQ6_STABA|nr:hypothetical protein DASB73_023060 [Starmerella bacillaris]
MSEYLGKTIRVSVADGRTLYGRLEAFTAEKDIIMCDSMEQQPKDGSARFVGPVVVPGADVMKIGLQHL